MPIELPPITIGELTNVPRPESGIRAAWAQAVSSRIIHRFASFAAMTASTGLPTGTTCSVGEVYYQKVASGGYALTTPVRFQSPGSGGIIGSGVPIQSVSVPADPRVTRNIDIVSHFYGFWNGGSPGAGEDTMSIQMLNATTLAVIDDVKWGLSHQDHASLTFFWNIACTFVQPAGVGVTCRMLRTATASSRVMNGYAAANLNRMFVTAHP